MELVGPGALTEYTGQRQRRSRGCVTVREAPKGFFIAGSSIEECNGIYGRVRRDSVASPYREIDLLYKHDDTGWLMALVEIKGAQEESDSEEDDYYYYERKPKPKWEWVFVDTATPPRDRFRHKGVRQLFFCRRVTLLLD